MDFWIPYKEERLHAFRFGTGKRLLIIFHGFADRGELFLPFEPALSDYYEVIAVDLPYHGASEWARDVFKPAHIQAIINYILTETGYSKYSLMAHSMGGFICLKLLEIEPERIEGLILLAPGGIYKALPFNMILFNPPVRRFLRWGGKGNLVPRVMRLAYKMRLLHKSFADFILTHFEKAHRRARIFNSWVSLGYFHPDLLKVHANLKTFQIPLVFFYGDKDKITPVSAARKFAEGLEKVEIQLVPDQNHFFINSILVQRLADWLKAHYHRFFNS
jgi:pimeloyl-ACP methyl ester carboxylesterase